MLERGCCLQIEFELNPAKALEFAQCLDDLGQTDARGCLQTSVYEDLETPGKILWVSKWRRFVDLDEYLESDTFRVLIGGMTTLGTVKGLQVQEVREETSAELGSFSRRRRGAVESEN